jgi:hypothetical protein
MLLGVPDGFPDPLPPRKLPEGPFEACTVPVVSSAPLASPSLLAAEMPVL